MSDWWRAVEDDLERLGDEGPDPWGELPLDPVDVGLTDAQRDFLAQLADLPVPRLDEE